VELAPHNVQVNAIAQNFVDNPTYFPAEVQANPRFQERVAREVDTVDRIVARRLVERGHEVEAVETGTAAVQAALAVSTAAAQPFGPKPAGVDDPVELRAGVGGSGHDHGPDGAPPPAPAVKPDPGAAPNAPPAPAAVKPDPGAVASGSAAPLPPHAPRAAVPPAPAFSGATLVICPLVAVLQWKAEIERFTAPGTLVVALYHGAKRTTSAAELADADVVLSSFGTLESDYRRSGATTSNLV
jgi:hypothetical protein